MTKLYILFAVLFVEGVLSASYNESNSYVDTVLKNNLPQEIDHLGQNKLNLPKFETKFTDKVGLITVNVKNKFNDGKLDELPRLERTTNCSAPFKLYENIIINCTLHALNIKVKYEVDIKYGRLPTVDAKIKSKVDNVTVAVEIIAHPLSNLPTLKSFQIVNMGTMQNTYTGLGPLNRYLSSLEEGYNENVKRILQGILESDIRMTLERAIVRSPMPIYYEQYILV